MLQNIRQWARRLKQHLLGLYIAIRRHDVPWIAKMVGTLVVAYAFSPIDLIPDFIPILGQLDDVLIVPLGVWLAIKLVPRELMRQCQEEAAHRIEQGERKPVVRYAGIAVILVWLILTGWFIWALWWW
jgi:uncharacterized membrane protein YkvA (DUF1232 family)